MNINIEKWYEELSFDKLQRKGYMPVGKPALIARIPNHLTDSLLEQAVLEANPNQPNLEVNACALYLRTNEQRSYTIAQPLKRISRKK